MSQCTFCAIAAGTVDSLIVDETETTVSFLDHRPLFPGHVLVIPREHYETIEDLPDDVVEPLFRTVRETSAAVRNALEAQGSFVAANNTISQSVPHLHVHVVPRRKGDGLRGFFWPRNPYRDDAHAATVRDLIAAELRC